MTPERYQQVVELCQAAWDLEPETRADFLARVCDRDLRQEVEAMLAADEWPTQILDQAPHDLAAEVLATRQGRSLIGETLSDYHVIARLSAGGMGEVFLAQDTRLGRRAALKILPEEYTSDPARLRRFEREARAVSALNHPNILTIYGIGQAGSRSFLATEFVEGQTLRAMMKAGPLPTELVIDIAVQAASALAAAHRAGFVHRDIKPENMILRPDGLLKILDFGLAKRAERPVCDANTFVGPSEFQSTAGLIMGTPRYMSPEQARGLPVDSQTDLFSLGAVLYEMLAGQPAIDGATPGDLLAAALSQNPTPLNTLRPNCPAALVRIVERALEKDRENRYRTAGEMLSDLKTVQREWESGVSNSAAVGRRMTVASRRRRKARWMAGIAAVFLAALIVLNPRLRPGGQPQSASPVRVESLAVLPLENLSADREQDYFADGMTDALIADLGQIGGLRVISRTSVMQYKGVHKPLPQIARELNVDTVVEGTVQHYGDQVRITAQLIQGSTERHLWAKQYERNLRDVMALQDEMARTIAEEIRVKLTPQEQKRLVSKHSVNPEAYEAYLRGRQYAAKFTSGGSNQAMDYFRRAIAIDPGYPLPYESLAYNYVLESNWPLPPKEAMPKARDAARRALELDDELAGAHTSLASVHLFYDWNWPAAERELKRALELNPSYAPAHYTRALLLTSIGRFDEGVSESMRAQELDPLALDAKVMLGVISYYAKRYDQAMRQALDTLQMDSSNWAAHMILGRVYLQKRQLPEALAELQRAKQSESQYPDITASLGVAYALAGREAKARQSLAELEHQSQKHYVPSDCIALVYLGLGQRDRAFAALEKAYAQRSLYFVWLKVDPELDSIRPDRRFQDLVRRVGFPP
jgi:TolB-like protein/Flp pilus assembly protein TadD